MFTQQTCGPSCVYYVKGAGNHVQRSQQAASLTAIAIIHMFPARLMLTNLTFHRYIDETIARMFAN
jgi:hypothetical protein